MGEGIYRILRHVDHTPLVYALDLPDEPDEVQRTLNLEEEASYILTAPGSPPPHAPASRHGPATAFPVLDGTDPVLAR